MAGFVLAGLWGYLLGAVPTGVLVGHGMGGVDVRRCGSGHTGGLNVARTVGVWGGVLTGVADMLLGVVAVAGAALLGDDPYMVAAAGVMAVVGHNWSAFIRFGGGIGLSTLIGGLLYLSPLRGPLAMFVLTPAWFVLVRFLHVHRARATVLIMLLVGPLLWALGLPLPHVLLGALGGLVVALKTLPDWNRGYGRGASARRGS